jgi:hypothetical protein
MDFNSPEHIITRYLTKVGPCTKVDLAESPAESVLVEYAPAMLNRQRTTHSYSVYLDFRAAAARNVQASGLSMRQAHRNRPMIRRSSPGANRPAYRPFERYVCATRPIDTM